MSDLPNGQADDQWHQLMGGTKTAKGNARLVANFKDLVILPLEEYNSMKEVHMCSVIRFVWLDHNPAYNQLMVRARGGTPTSRARLWNFNQLHHSIIIVC